MSLGLHHLHKHAQKPHDLKETGDLRRYVAVVVFDKFAIVVGVLTAFFNLPQLILIWVDGNTQGVSLVSWLGFTAASLFWLFYAILHKERLLIRTFGVTLIFQILIVLGILVR